MRFVAVGLRFVIIRRARVCSCVCVCAVWLRVQPGSEISGSNAGRVDNGCFWSVGFAIFWVDFHMIIRCEKSIVFYHLFSRLRPARPRGSILVTIALTTIALLRERTTRKSRCWKSSGRSYSFFSWAPKIPYLSTGQKIPYFFSYDFLPIFSVHPRKKSGNLEFSGPKKCVF